MPEPTPVLRDGRELWTLSADEALSTFGNNFGVAFWRFLSLKEALRVSERHSVSIVDDPKSSSLLFGAYAFKELDRDEIDGTMPSSEDALKVDVSSFAGCNSSKCCSSLNDSLNFANFFLRCRMILACCRFASSRISTSSARFFLEARSPFNSLSKNSAVPLLPNFCKRG